MENKGSKKKKQMKSNDTQLSFGFMDSKPETEIKLLPKKKQTSVTVIFPGSQIKKVD